MEHTGMHALCCGANGWMNCYNANKQIQRTRIKETISVSADILVTTCPKCQIHLKCANAIPDIQENLEIKDITKLIVEAIC
jgi:Fe-S oxidoreductase